MGWSNWRCIAGNREWFPQRLDWSGPACYELALGGVRCGDLTVVYVGETVNERRRISAYASHGSHLFRQIERHLRKGWFLWYRAQAVESKRHAVNLQNRLLYRFDYPWNIVLNS